MQLTLLKLHAFSYIRGKLRYSLAEKRNGNYE